MTHYIASTILITLAIAIYICCVSTSIVNIYTHCSYGRYEYRNHIGWVKTSTTHCKWDEMEKSHIHQLDTIFSIGFDVVYQIVIIVTLCSKVFGDNDKSSKFDLTMILYSLFLKFVITGVLEYWKYITDASVPIFIFQEFILLGYRLFYLFYIEYLLETGHKIIEFSRHFIVSVCDIVKEILEPKSIQFDNKKSE